MIGTGDHAQRVAEQHSLTQAVEHVEDLCEADHEIEVATEQPYQKIELRVLDDLQMSILMGFAPSTQCQGHDPARETRQAADPNRLWRPSLRVQEIALGEFGSLHGSVLAWQ